MSSRNYTVTVNMKDGGLLKKLEALQSGSPMNGKGGGGTVASSGGGIFNRLQELGSNQLLKLTGIGIGVGSLVALTVKSSGILQSSLKLWETSFMLVFKPFGDLIGLALRPLALLMISWAIPFYKVAGPWFRDYGSKIGEALTANQGANLLGVTGPAGGTASAVIDLAPKIVFTVGEIQKAFDAAGQALYATLSNVPSIFFGFLSSIGQSIWQKLQSIPSIFFGFLSSIGQSIWSGLTSIPDVFVGIFTGLASSITEALSDIPAIIRDAILSWVKAATGGLGGASTAQGGALSPGLMAGAGIASKMAAIADTLE